MLSEANGGATAMAPCEGVWKNTKGVLIVESPVVVYSFVEDPAAFIANIPRLKVFLHRMGRESNQGEIAFEFDGAFFRITEFDEE